MNELAKWAWIIVLTILGFGPWAILIIGIDIVAYLLIVWLKPKWIDKL